MKKILDLGCGQGFRTYVLSRKNDVVGIDLSKDDIAVAQKRYPGVSFKVMSAEHLKFKSNEFDEIYAIDVIEHVDHVNRVVSEIHRVLASHGTVVINVPFFLSENWLKSIRPTYFKEIHHVRVFQDQELEKIMSKKGFTLKEKKKIGFLQHVELYVLFKTGSDKRTQVSIGDWRATVMTKVLHGLMLYFDLSVFQTPFVWFPLWIITIPLGLIINGIGNQYFSKSLYYEFTKA